MQTRTISIVVPIFNEEKGIWPLFQEIEKVLFGLEDYSFELIFVNDGSRDGSILELDELAKRQKNVKIINFARNFGKEIALSAGCHFAKGDAVVTLDADLQHPPSLIPDLIKKWEAGYDVVYTVRKENKGAGFIKKMTSRIYWWIFNKVAQIDSDPHSTDFRLMDKKVIDVFRKFSERGRIFRGIVDWIGFKRGKIEFMAPERKFGSATYSYKKLLDLALNSFTSFSLLPLRLAGYAGVLITSLSVLLLIIMFITRWFIDPTFFSSIAFVIVFNTFLIGFVLICLGFIALYIARIHDEVTGRPLYIIKNTINISEKEILSEDKFIETKTWAMK